MTETRFTRGLGCVILAGALTLPLTACPDDSVTPDPIRVAISPTSSRVRAGSSQNFTGYVLNDSRAEGINWTLHGAGCSGDACGTLSTTSSGSGDPITYSAPGSMPSPARVTLTAVSVSDAKVSGFSVIDILPPGVTVNLNGTWSASIGGQAQISATIANNPSGAGVTWTLSGTGCAGAACGALSATTSADGQLITYTAPAVVPNPNSVTITATSVADHSVSASGSMTITSNIGVTLTSTPATLQVGAPQQLTATVTGDPRNAGVAWALSCSSNACGTLSQIASASGVAVTYTAPAAVPPGTTVSITATSSTDYTKGASAGVTITSTVSSVTVDPTLAGVDVGTTRSFTATVADDPSNLGVSWTLGGPGCAGDGCGTLSSITTASGTAVTYRAPATAPSPTTVTLTATSVTDFHKTAAANIVVTTPGVISVTMLDASTTLNLTASNQFRAAIFNDPQNLGVTWTATCAVADCGSFAPNSSASGAAVTYTAPNIVPNPQTVTIRAASVADNTKYAELSVTVTSQIQVAVSPTGFIGVDVSTTEPFTATVANDPGNLGVTWSLTCTGDCGTITPSGLYTAPSTVPTPVTVTVIATSVADWSKSVFSFAVITTPGVITVVVSPSGGSMLVGSSRSFTAYVFHDPADAGVTWSATSTASTSGAFTPTSSLSGVPVSYQAGGAGTATLKATSVTDPLKSGTATVSVVTRPPCRRFCGRP